MDVLTAITIQADELTDKHGWHATPDADLVGNEDGHTVLISRHSGGIRDVVRQKGAASDAEYEDRLQSAILGFLESLTSFDADLTNGDTVLPHAWEYMGREVVETNRTASPRPAASNDHDRFWRAMAATDNDPIRAREWSALQKLTGRQLEALSDAGNVLAADILDGRIAVWERKELDIPEMLDSEASRGRGLSPEVFDAVYATLHYTHLDAATGHEDDASLSKHDTTEAPSARSDYETAEERIAVAQMLNHLDQRERVVISALFGVGGREQKKVIEVAEEVGLGRSRVLGIRKAALSKLRKAA